MHWIWLIRDCCCWNFRNFCAIKTEDCWVLIFLHGYLKILQTPKDRMGRKWQKIACNLYYIICRVRSDITPYCSPFTTNGSNSDCKSYSFFSSEWSQNNTQFTSYWNIWPLQSWFRQSQKEIWGLLLLFLQRLCGGNGGQMKSAHLQRGKFIVQSAAGQWWGWWKGDFSLNFFFLRGFLHMGDPLLREKKALQMQPSSPFLLIMLDEWSFCICLSSQLIA